AAFNVRDVAAGTALNSIRPGLVERLAAGKVPGDFFVGKFIEVDVGGFHERTTFDVWKTDEGDSGQDRMRAARKLFEHAAGIIAGTRLAENQAVENDSRVGSDDDGGADGARGDEFGFGVREALNHIVR